MKKLLISIFAAFFCINATATNMLSVDSMQNLVSKAISIFWL